MKSPALIGSHFFGGAHERSDIDWCMEDTPTARHWLQANDWVLLCEMPGPQQETSFWIHKYKRQECFLVKSVERRILVRDFIHQINLFKRMKNKRNRKLAWHAIGACVEELHRLMKSEDDGQPAPLLSYWKNPL
jgi:hypothetical protein